MNIKKQAFQLAIAASCIALSACTSLDNISPKTKAAINENSKNSSAQVDSFLTKSANGGIENTSYISSKIVRKDAVKEAKKPQLPNFFGNDIELSSKNEIKLSDAIKEITLMTGIKISVAQDLDGGGGGGMAAPAAMPAGGAMPQISSSMQSQTTAPSKRMMSISGVYKLKDLLDMICSQLSVSWSYDETDNTITFFRNETKIWYVFLQSGKVSNSASVGAATSGGGGGGGAAAPQSNITTSFVTKTDSWALFEQTIKSMLTKDGSMSINDQVGTLLVSDTPAIIKRVNAYVVSLNKTMTRQIAVQVKVLSVVVNHSAQQGLNWNLVWNRLATGVAAGGGYSVNYLSPLSTIATGTAGQLGITTIAGANSTANFGGSNAFVQALNTVTDTTTISEPVLLTTNNQPVPLAVTTDTTYISSQTPGVTTTTGAVTPPTYNQSTIKSGFTVNIVPMIIDDDNILMQFSMDNSSLKLNTNPSVPGLQQPELSETGITHRIKVHNGTTVVLNGYRIKQQDSSGTKGIMGFGSSGAYVEKELIVTLTPVIQD
jgi:type IVB pilus formation R64 PilN family outer membrane protein